MKRRQLSGEDWWALFVKADIRREEVLPLERNVIKYFTFSKTFKPKFTRRKARKSQQFWHLNKLNKTNNRNRTYTVQIFPKKGLIWHNWVISQTFTQTCQYFYTDISVISVTFYNSEKEGGAEVKKVLKQSWSGRQPCPSPALDTTPHICRRQLSLNAKIVHFGEKLQIVCGRKI